MARSDPRNSTQYWWDRHLSGLSLLCADFTTHEYPPHTHDALVVAVTEQGGSVVRSRGEVEQATPSTLFVFNPAEPHARLDGLEPALAVPLDVPDPPGARARWRAASASNAVPYFTRNTFGDRDLIASFLAMHLAIEEGRDVFRERELLIGTFGRLFQRHGSGGGRIAPTPRDRAAAGQGEGAHAGRLRVRPPSRGSGRRRRASRPSSSSACSSARSG